MTKETTLALKNVLSLPLKWVTETGRPYSLKQVPEDREALRTRLETELLRELSEELGDRGEVLRTFFTASERDGVMTLTLRAECLERIDAEESGE